MKRCLLLALVLAAAMLAGHNRVWGVDAYDDGERVAWIGTISECGRGSQASITYNAKPCRKTWRLQLSSG